MKGVTFVDSSWIAGIGRHSSLVELEAPLRSPSPWYDAEGDRVMCYRHAILLPKRWKLPLLKVCAGWLVRLAAAHPPSHTHTV